MSKVKVTYANGVVQFYDENAHSPGTHFGDADGNAHRLVADEAAGDSEEARFEDTATPVPAPADDFVPSG